MIREHLINTMPANLTALKPQKFLNILGLLMKKLKRMAQLPCGTHAAGWSRATTG